MSDYLVVFFLFDSYVICTYIIFESITLISLVDENKLAYLHIAFVSGHLAQMQFGYNKSVIIFLDLYLLCRAAHGF